MEETDFKTGNMIYEKYGVPSSALRELVARGVVRMIRRQIDVCHFINYYSASDVARFVNEGANDEQFT